MQLSLQNFSSLVNNMAASAQGACSTLLDVSVGSVLRALIESSAAVALWMQYLILQVLSMTRLATSVGPDADSWVADFGLARLPATTATGAVTMSSFSPASQPATVPAGALVKTSDGLQSFVVTGGPYSRAQGTASVTVPVVASVAGTAGNVQAGTVSILGTAIPGIDTVSNLLPMTGGLAAESDQALRARFVAYINTRSQATEQAVANAIASIQQGLTFVIQENVTASGSSLPGHFNIIVDDGSGAPPASLLTAITRAVDVVRPVGSSFAVSAPTLIVASISLTVTLGQGSLSQVSTVIADAIARYVNGLAVGQALRFSRLSGLTYDASPQVVNVISVGLNGASADLGGSPGSVVRCGAISCSVG